ncbi:hypothetical protein [Natrarchaeobius halalkaliphilus]|nr:hypothetical protein [Natrarchaeobius halalkaliphilus]
MEASSMPHVPNFPSEDGTDGEESNRESIIDRLIDDGNWPSPAGD